jgi:hypothetical protein
VPEPTSRKRRTVAVLLSAIVWPGAGQIYNRELVKGLVFIGVSGVASLVFMVKAAAILVQGLGDDPAGMSLEEIQALSDRLQGSPALAVTGFVLTLVWLAGIIDAYRGARRL